MNPLLRPWLSLDMDLHIESFYHPQTFTLTYLVYDAHSKDAVIIDPVMDYDPVSISVSNTSINILADFINRQELRIHYVLETHAHADHLSGAQALKKRFSAPIAISAEISKVQQAFKTIFNMAMATDGSQFDKLLADQDVLEAGTLQVKALHTPGHTPACMSFLIEDAVFTGDALFMPDFGVGRCDFPAGSAEALYDSVHKQLYSLPERTRVFVGHDYQPGGRALAFQSTIGREKEENIHLPANRSKEDFVAMRTGRDQGLKAPALLFPSIQVNANAGNLPGKEENGRSYIKLPIGLFE